MNIIESIVRRMAKLKGLTLQKSQCRVQQSPDYGTYRLVDPYSGLVVAGAGSSNYGMTLDEVVESLKD